MSVQVPKTFTLKTGELNSVTSPITMCEVSHRFTVVGDPLANCKFRVLDPTDPDASEPLAPPDATDGDGVATFEVSVETTDVLLVFEGGRSFRLAVGHLDPAAASSGCTQRLRHLGLLACRSDDDVDEDEDARRAWMTLALQSFQQANGVPDTGELDDATVAKLIDVYGA